MGKALYRKYRSKFFAEVVGQEHITTTLQRAIKSGKISHAYLFTGPRGVGKTSVARILAHEVNGLSYQDDTVHLDIIEIDAASNRRIDEIRELRDKVHITPTSAKYKVYIIDEVHMLTREAFNALLKTLEEPPAHCIFILATTEFHKLPETIISRTQRFAFKPVDKKIAAKHLGVIARNEKIAITEGALELLAEHGQGSFRDSISLLDQLSTHKEKITEEVVRELIGLPPESAITSLITYLKTGQQTLLIGQLESLASQGVNPAATARDLGKHLRSELILGSAEPWIPTLLRQLLEVPASVSQAESLEIALLEAATSNTNKNVEPKTRQTKATLSTSSILKENNERSKIVTKRQKMEAVTDTIDEQPINNFNLKSWPQIIEAIKKQNASLYTALRLARPHYSEDTLTLCFEFPLHQKKVNQAPQKALIGDVVERLTGAKIKIDCSIDKEIFKATKGVTEKIIRNAPKTDDGALKAISSIFGGAEMVES